MFELGELSRALPALKTKLIGDPQFGFSDALRLIDAMLMVQRHRFSKADLVEIHTFVAAIDEHSLRIDERLAAVETFRIATEKPLEALPRPTQHSLPAPADT